MNTTEQQQMADALEQAAERVRAGNVVGLVLVVQDDEGGESRATHAEGVGPARQLVAALSVMLADRVDSIRQAERAAREMSGPRVKPASVADVRKLVRN